MLLRFSKMHCLGDDLMLVELLSQHAFVHPQQIQQWSSRSRGVGFKRLVLIEVPRQPEVDFSCRVFAQDGTELDCSFVDLCCVTRLLSDKRLTTQSELRLDTRTGQQNTTLSVDGWVSVEYPLQNFTQLEFAQSWQFDLSENYQGTNLATALSAGQQGEQPQNKLRLELVKDELSLSLCFEQQKVELRGLATRTFEGQIRI